MWNPFPETVAILLGLFLVVLGAGIVIAGRRLRRDIRLPMPWNWLKVVIVILWILQILILLRIFKDISDVDPSARVTGPVLPITLLSAVCTFGLVAYFLRRYGPLSAIGSAIVATIAGPMVFELPFVLIVGPVSTTPTHPGATLTIPFFIAMFTTLAMLTFSSKSAITRYSLYSLGAMFLVFAIWAVLFGFAYPSGPGPFLLNAISKVLGFATTGAMFWRGSRSAGIAELAAKDRSRTVP
jgi:hypothetical protein